MYFIIKKKENAGCEKFDREGEERNRVVVIILLKYRTIRHTDTHIIF